MSQKRQLLEKKLGALQEKEAQLRAQLHDIQARDRLMERKRDTRRILILGRLCKKLIQDEPDNPVSQTLLKSLDTAIKNPKDRALFGLTPSSDHPRQND